MGPMKRPYKGLAYYVLWCSSCDGYIDQGWYLPIQETSKRVHMQNYPGHEPEIIRNVKFLTPEKQHEGK